MNEDDVYAILNGKIRKLQSGGGATNYGDLNGKPQINGVTLQGNLTSEDLGIPSLEFLNQTIGSPVGEIISYMGTTAPSGYLICDGSVYPVSDYPYLTQHFEENFGSAYYFGGADGDFAVPDLRGEFLRGSGENGHVNQGNGEKIGIHQNATLTPTIGVTTKKGNESGQLYIPNLADATSETASQWGSNWDFTTSTAAVGKPTIVPTRNGLVVFSSVYDQEALANSALRAARPTNTSVLYCIKYEPCILKGSGMQCVGTKVETLYTNPNPSSDYITVENSSNQYAIEMTDKASNYDRLEISYGFVMIGGYLPTCGTAIYHDCKTKNLYERLCPGVSKTESVAAQFNIAKDDVVKVRLFAIYSTNILGFYIKSIKGFIFNADS